MKKDIFLPLKLKKHTLKNRIVMPAMVTFGFGINDGFVSDELVDYYEQRAKGGVGMIITEASCVMEDARLRETQIGLWKDEHIAGHKKTVDAIHKYNIPVLAQLHHGGIKSVGDNLVAPSDFDGEILGRKINARGLTKKEIITIKEAFLNAADRAKESGYDGVEIHCAHSYLLSSFLSPISNLRDDEYGGNLENRMRLTLEIITEIENKYPEFIISVRIGYNEPELDDGIEIAKAFEQAGVDLLNISTGFGSGGYMPENEMEKAPKNFPFNIRLWGASQIKPRVSCSVMGVGGVRQPHQAENIIEKEYVDLVGVGRGLLCDPNWADKIITGKEICECYNCRRCIWSSDLNKCPGRKRYLNSL